MKRFVILFSALVLALSLCACGAPAVDTPSPPAGSPATPIETATPAPPAYKLIDSSKYSCDGKDCVGYRVEIAEGATEEGMRAVFTARPSPHRYGDDDRALDYYVSRV